MAEQVFEMIIKNLEVRFVGPRAAQIERALGIYSGRISYLINSTNLGQLVQNSRRWGLHITLKGVEKAVQILGYKPAVLTWTPEALEWLFAYDGVINVWNITPEDMRKAVETYVRQRDKAEIRIREVPESGTPQSVDPSRP
jgi:hypothetical protein